MGTWKRGRRAFSFGRISFDFGEPWWGDALFQLQFGAVRVIPSSKEDDISTDFCQPPLHQFASQVLEVAWRYVAMSPTQGPKPDVRPADVLQVLHR